MSEQMSLFNESNVQVCPFTGKRICITGNFTGKKNFVEWLRKQGAEVTSSASKNVDFAIVGDMPNEKVISIIAKLRVNGFDIPEISVDDIPNILQGQWDRYQAAKKVKKDLNLTMVHYRKFHVDMGAKANPIAGKELFYGKGFAGDFQTFDQITENLGACGDNIAIYPDTNICVLSDATVEALRRGDKDETIRFIEDSYNNGKAITFNLSFMSESDILDFCKERCEKCDDEVTMILYNRYMGSIPK